MRNIKRSVPVFALLFVTALLAMIAGWIGNVVQLAYADWTTITGLLILKVAGVLVVPLGSVLGWVGFF